MDLDRAEQAVIDRFYRKTRSAGGARAGYALRRQALGHGVGGGVDVVAGVESLSARGLVTVSESGSYVYLTEAGAEIVAETTRG